MAALALGVCATAGVELELEEKDAELAALGRHALGFDHFEDKFDHFEDKFDKFDKSTKKCPSKCKKHDCCKCNKYGETLFRKGKRCTTGDGHPGHCVGKYR